MTNGAVSAGVAQQPVIPAGFLWNFAKYPMSIVGNGAGGFLCDFVPEVYHQPALSGTTYFVSTVGSDSNSGLTSYANALASIGHAITLGNAGGVPYCVVVKAGLYYRTQGFFGLIPTQACAFLADGGRVVTGTFDNLTWALVAGTTATYSSSRSNANRMFDILNNDSFGNYNEMTNVSLSAVPTADLAAGSWGTYNNIVYARRSDAAAITSSNTRLMIGNVSILDFTGFFSGLTGVTQNCFIGGTTATSGFDFQGGGAGGIVFTNNATANVMGRNGTTKYAGGILSYSGCKGIRSDNLNGLTAWVNWESSCNADDGFNGHNSNYAVTGYTPQFLTINCRANNNGRGNSTSNNGITAHETCLFIDINGSYDSNYGGNSAFIDNTQAWHIGTSCQRSLGDTARGGTVPPIEFEAQNACRMWLCDTTGFSNPTSGAFAIQTAGTAHVSKHNHTSIIGPRAWRAGGRSIPTDTGFSRAGGLDEIHPHGDPLRPLV